MLYISSAGKAEDCDQLTEAKSKPIPERIANRYRVDGLLGRGGMGAVYRVFDERRKLTVALKCLTVPESTRLRRQLGDMFRLEYRTLHQLSHPSVIQVHEYGVSELGPYYTMELLDGEDLHKLAPVPWRDVCRYARDVCSSLALLHSRGLLHRDVSPRNVRCNGGRAKLIDFGAMVAMGADHDVVGTPPLVPPEAFDRQALDGRSDLYSLGATMYFALTGRHAFPTRQLRRLPELWRMPPAAPSSLADDVPAELDALVLRLLAQDAEARPRSAAEVMERLSAVAGISGEEQLHVPSAYLTTPTLVGRETELKALQAKLRAMSTGRSRQRVILGEAGVGRSRLLDAAVVEARLEGLQVLRIQASEVPHGKCAIGQVLLERIAELSTSQPATAQSQTDGSPSPESVPPGGLMSSVRAALGRAAAQHPVLVAVDNVESLDHASQALLATLHKSAKQHLLVLLTIQIGAPLDATLRTRVQEAKTLRLAPMSSVQTEELLGSVFGNVPGLAPLSARIHERSRGNARATLELAQHLVDCQRARYELGRWVLPDNLSADDLPQAWAEALDLRLAKLDGPALALAHLLAFAVQYSRDPAELDTLISNRHGPRESALDALVASNIFRVDGHQYNFATGAYESHLKEQCPDPRRTEICRELATWLRTAKRDAIDVAVCELAAQEHGRAIDTILAELKNGSRWNTAPPAYADALQQAMAACDRLKRPRRQRFTLLTELVRVGERMGVPNMRAHFFELLKYLRADGALDAYESLPDSLDPGDRLSQAFEITQIRYDALPESQQVLAPAEGLRTLAKAVRQAGAFGAISVDYELLSALPSLVPFAGLSPAIKSATTGTMPACFHVVAGRYEKAYECYQSTLARLEEPDHAGLDDDYWRWACSALRYVSGVLYAGLGIEAALGHAKELEQDSDWAVPAWDIRRGYYLRLGDRRSAEACRLRMERMTLESGRPPPIVNGSARTELYVAAHAGDLPGVRLAMERIREQIRLHPGYAPYRPFGDAVIDMLCGNYASGTEKAERALTMAEAGRHECWAWIACCLLETLLGEGRNQEAYERGNAFLRDAERADLGVISNHIHIPLAVAEARLGHHDDAIARIDLAIDRYVRIGSHGLNPGWAYEHRARIAIEMKDPLAFMKAANSCALEYGKSKGGHTLTARYEQLRTDARRAGLRTPSMLPSGLAAEGTSPENSASDYTDLELGSTSMRRETSLQLLMRESGASAGQLYLYDEDGIHLCHSQLGEQDTPDLTGLIPCSTAELAAELEDDDDGLVTVTAVAQDEAKSGWISIVLGYRDCNSGFQRTGLALLYSAGPALRPPEALIDTVGRTLVAADTTGVTVLLGRPITRDGSAPSF